MLIVFHLLKSSGNDEPFESSGSEFVPSTEKSSDESTFSSENSMVIPHVEQAWLLLKITLNNYVKRLIADHNNEK